MDNFITDLLVANDIAISNNEPTLVEIHVLIQKLDKLLSSIPLENILHCFRGNEFTVRQHIKELLHLDFLDYYFYKRGELKLTQSGLLANLPEGYNRSIMETAKQN